MNDNLPGVQFNAPPPGPIMAEVNRLALDAAEALPPGAQGGVFGIVTEHGANAVIVHKVRDNFTVMGYIGKQWGKPLEYGAAAVVTW